MTAHELVEMLRPAIADERVLDAIAAVPRDRFVAPELRADAWRNQPLPIGAGQTISQPLVVAHMCELLRLTGEETVLDVGTGSGYHAAILGRLAARVVSIERHAELSALAAGNLRAAGVGNVELVVGDGTLGHEARAPYHAINVAAAAGGGIPPALEAQLADGGRLVIPVDAGGFQQLVLVEGGRRVEHGRVSFVPLLGSGS
jgi:protein-L-isoaspartate(D-aspartate) O-methyltransferase